MTNLIKADFNGTQVLFQSDAYLHATAIATRFGKKAKDYLKTERTQEYINALIKLNNSKRTKIPFEENQLVTVKKGSPANGGGTWLHPKLAIDFARWLSAEFAVWCDEQIEKILYSDLSEQPKLDDLSTVESREPLKDAVNTMVHKCRLSYSDCWRMVHQRFKVGHVNQLTEAEVTDAISYVHDKIIEGELMPRHDEAPQRLINDNRKSRVAAIAMMKAGSLAKRRQDKLIEKLESLLYDARKCVREIDDCSGMISDGLVESRFRFAFNPTEIQEANVIAAERFNKRYK